MMSTPKTMNNNKKAHFETTTADDTIDQSGWELVQNKKKARPEEAAGPPNLDQLAHDKEIVEKETINQTTTVKIESGLVPSLKGRWLEEALKKDPAVVDAAAWTLTGAALKALPRLRLLAVIEAAVQQARVAKLHAQVRARVCYHCSPLLHAWLGIVSPLADGFCACCRGTRGRLVTWSRCVYGVGGDQSGNFLRKGVLLEPADRT